MRAAVAAGAADGRQVKQLTRTGMGWCQGRMCGYAADRLCAFEAEAQGATAGALDPPDPSSAPSSPTAAAPTASAPTAAAIVPAPERLVAAPVSLGALADLSAM